MIDAHIHLDQYHIENVRDSIKRWQEFGVEGVVAVSSNLSSSYDTLKLKQEFPDFVRAALGYHPEGAPPENKELYELVELIHRERRLISGIGEIGLPTYQKADLLETYTEENYIEVLEVFLTVSKQEELPVSLHAVHDEAKTVLAMLKRFEPIIAHFHWLKAAPSILTEIIASGYYISVTPEVCYRNRDQLLVKQVPIDQLLIETDGPWQHNGPFENIQTTPLLLEDIIICLANILHMSRHELSERICHNTRQLWK